MKNYRKLYILKRTDSRNIDSVSFFIFIASFFLAASILFVSVRIPSLSFFAKSSFLKAKKEAALLILEKDAIAFEIQTALISKAPECFPIETSKRGFIGVQYLFCSDHARERDGSSVKISESFTVPTSLARRYNFWRRIYSTWSKNQYVLHSAEWPEVIFATFDLSQAPETLSAASKERHLKKITSHYRELYSDVLRNMHKLRDKPDRFNYTMQRIAKMMAHIPDDNKYLKAAEKIRVQKGQREFIEKGLHVAPKYMEAIEVEFLAQGVPVEISNLAFVESSFNTRAYSKVGASGVFQIMPLTGKQYLNIGAGYDERNDPIKAGRAAAKILKFYYGITGSWPLAITAYNHGVGGIRKAIAKTGSQDLATLINHYDGPGFGFASKNFYSSFLGMLATLQDKQHLFPGLPKVTPLMYKSYKLAKPASTSAIRSKFSISREEFLELNLDLSPGIHNGRMMIPKGYVIKVPYRPTQISQDR